MSEKVNTDEAYRQANRLNHLSMVYVGALIELATGHHVGLIPSSRPGLKECRDLFNLMLNVRAELNAITNVLYKSGMVKHQDLVDGFAEEYKWLAEAKCRQFHCTVTDVGLHFDIGDIPHCGN